MKYGIDPNNIDDPDMEYVEITQASWDAITAGNPDAVEVAK